MLFFWVLKGYIVWGSRRTYQAVKEALSCFLPIGPLPVSPGRPVSLWQQLLAACGGRGWAAQLQTSVGPEPGPPSSLFLFSHTHTHTYIGAHSLPSTKDYIHPPHTVSTGEEVVWSSQALTLFCLLSLLLHLLSFSQIFPPFSNSVCLRPSLYWSECSSIQVH